MMNLAELANRKMKFRPSFGLMMRDLLLSREDVVFLVADSARACRFECPESCQDRLVECGYFTEERALETMAVGSSL